MNHVTYISKEIMEKNFDYKEYPILDNNEPYYPINDKANRSRHKKYKDYLNKKIKNLFLVAG